VTLDDALHAAALLAGLFALMSGIGFFFAGIMPGASAPWWKQGGSAALSLCAAFYLLRYALNA
jgi:membrane protein implicated in regulation of membrane protease activity